ncbi:MAG: DUF1080 domain-containing protein [Verrucomicrobia bacterium]|nr:DUF1080 domain-containing protein [Verrucomicrobiota bacterium]
MKTPSAFLASALVLGAWAITSWAAATGPVFYGDPPDDHHPWAVHDRNRPQPVRVAPGTFSAPEQPGQPPSDAIRLFDGTDLSQWETDKGAPAPWRVRDGYMEVVPGSGGIRTKAKFADCQLHLEWAAPAKVEGSGQGRGNSGVFLMGRLEVQVLDSYNNETYADGHAGAYYGIHPPLALPLRPPGEWQVYDIVFRRPIYRDGKPVDPGYLTVFLNGVLVQDHAVLEGSGGHMGRTRPGPFPAQGPLSLQDHGNPTRFRNIWYRELPPRPADGGTDGYLTPEATLAKRREVAASIREATAKSAVATDPISEMLGLMESLVYELERATSERAQALAEQYVASLKQLTPAQLPAKRDEARRVRDAFKYLVKFQRLPAEFAPLAALEQLIKEQGWDKRRQ